MDCFGRVTKNPTRLRGPRGEPGLDFIDILPVSSLYLLRNFEFTACFTITTLDDVHIKSKIPSTIIDKWSSKSGKHTLVPLDNKQFPKLIKIKEFTFSVQIPSPLVNYDLTLFDPNKKNGFICVTFKSLSENTQTLIHTGKFANDQDGMYLYREIKISGDVISVHGYYQDKLVEHPIQCNTTRNYVTFMLSWVSNGDSCSFTYQIDSERDAKGYFSLQSPKIGLPGFLVGSAPSAKSKFSGFIHSLEIYHTDREINDHILHATVDGQYLRPQKRTIAQMQHGHSSEHINCKRSKTKNGHSGIA